MGYRTVLVRPQDFYHLSERIQRWLEDQGIEAAHNITGISRPYLRRIRRIGLSRKASAGTAITFILALKGIDPKTATLTGEPS